MFEIIHVLRLLTRVSRHLGMHLRTQLCYRYCWKIKVRWRCKKTIQSLGFDEHCLWNIRGAQKERYVSPILLTNGASIEYPGAYGPDIQQAYAERFIRRHVDQPFFLYYPMTLPHYPFQPTPDSSDWDPTMDPTLTIRNILAIWLRIWINWLEV